jgi:hypothetical protein
VSPRTSVVFDLPERLAAKADPVLVARDEQHFTTLAAVLEQRRAELEALLAEQRLARAGTGQAALDRDLEVHRLTARLRVLSRYGLDLCLGRMVPDDGREPLYLGRVGLTDLAGEPLLVDWRAPAAEPFFGATHGNPMGLASRRRYRWARGHITDYWDEVFTPDGLEGNAALDDQSAFVAGLGGSRSGRMRDVLATIQADQDAVVRAGSEGALVVDGGPGTGKTVVALHRTAYLLYSDPRLGHRRGGVLFVGPHEPYLAYVADVLPSLGEEGVRPCTLRDLVPEGATAGEEGDPEVARLKAAAAMVGVVEPAVGLYEQPPTEPLLLETPWGDLRVEPQDWAEAFDAPDPGTQHNEARDDVREALVAVLVDRVRDAVDDAADESEGEQADQFDAYGLGGEDPGARYRRVLVAHRGLARALERAWPLLDPAELVGDLWSVPAYLRRCAPWLGPDEVARLQRPEADAWTVSDLPLLDAFRHRVGDPDAELGRRRRETAAAAERARMDRVVDDLVAADDSEMHVMSMLRGQDLRAALVDEDASGPAGTARPAGTEGPFAHVVVDEAQELTDAEWQMVLRRCPSRSLTVVGDRAQARHGFTESWEERLSRVGLGTVRRATLTVNYRTPEEVMREAEPVIRSVLPDANVPTSVRRSGVPVHHGDRSELSGLLDDWLEAHAEGTACVIGDPSVGTTARLRSLTPELAKGLEFDLVVLVDPHAWGTGAENAVDRYVAMTRATERLVVLTSVSRAPGAPEPPVAHPERPGA